MKRIFWVFLALSALGLNLAVMAQSSLPIERVSVASNGSESENGGSIPSISADGRFVTFWSSDWHLLPGGDTNSTQDVFVRDRQLGTTTRVSVVSGGGEADLGGDVPVISADGRYVVFRSVDHELVAGDTNNRQDIFVHDRQTSVTTRVSVSSTGVQGNGTPNQPKISANGQVVVFASDSTNHVTGDTNGYDDIFVHDRQTGETTRVSLSSTGTQANSDSQDPAISGDGRYVTFASQARNLVAGDTLYNIDIFLHDRVTGTTIRVTNGLGGTLANSGSNKPSISYDGRYVAYASTSSNLTADDTNFQGDIFVYDRVTGGTTRVSVSSNGTGGDLNAYYPSISDDGRYVAFSSTSTNLVSGDTNNKMDIFVHDRETGETERVSIGYNGAQINQDAYTPAISGDGTAIAFESRATNIVANDTNQTADVFVAYSPFFPVPDSANAAPHGNRFTTHTPTLTWNRLTWALTYDIQIAETTNFSTSLIYEGSTSGPELEHLVTQSLENGDYFWRVRGVGAGGAGNWSAADMFVVDAD